MVSDYSGLNFNEAVELDCVTYKKLVRDAYICKLADSAEGREYLENAWILTQTKPDTAALRNKFGSE